AFIRMFAQGLAGIGTETTAFLRIGFLFRNQGNSAIEPHREHVVAFLQACVDLAVLDVGAEASDAGKDRLAVFRRQPDFARQRQQTECFFEIDVVWRDALRNSGSLGLFNFRLFLALLWLWRFYLFA